MSLQISDKHKYTLRVSSTVSNIEANRAENYSIVVAGLVRRRGDRRRRRVNVAFIARTHVHCSRKSTNPIVARQLRDIQHLSFVHPGNYASWHASYHRTMTQVATTQNLPNEMEKTEFVFNGREYKVERHGDSYFARTRREGEEFGDARQIVIVTGSHNLQIPWMETDDGRTLEQFPFGYIVAEKMWAPVSETFLIPPDLKEYYSIGAWNGACMDCHVTHGESRFVKGNKWDSQVAEFGIACEACHSEGHEHIARNRDPIRRFKIHLTSKTDSTMTNPSNRKVPSRRWPAANVTACGPSTT